LVVTPLLLLNLIFIPLLLLINIIALCGNSTRLQNWFTLFNFTGFDVCCN
jgi:hypothetical protein